MPPEDTSASSILREAAARISAADAKVHEAETAFAAGKFEDYFEREYKKVEEAVQDEYDILVDERADGPPST